MTVRTVQAQVSRAPVRDLKGVVAFIEKELRPFLQQTRAAINEFLPRPRLPVHTTAPVTDEVVDPTGLNPPLDGYLSFCSADGNLYIRNGSSTHQVI